MHIDSFNVKLKTLGGKQFWTDIRNCGGWRIQENAVTGHFRLIDSKNYRHCWGSADECHEFLERKIEAGEAAYPTGRVVIVLHGLIRATGSMQSLGRYLDDRTTLTALDFEYASTRRPIAEHAAALKSVVDQIGSDVTEINFVGHSMGNIVVRRYLHDVKSATGSSDPRFKRMVMIGPPNQGSKIARLLSRRLLFKWIAGVAGQELGAKWDELEPVLAKPEFEFGIIAGGQNNHKRFSNFLLPGQDDFTVSVEETKLSGATDFLVRPLLHSIMMRHPETLEATLNYLEHGYFVSSESRQTLD